MGTVAGEGESLRAVEASLRQHHLSLQKRLSQLETAEDLKSSSAKSASASKVSEVQHSAVVERLNYCERLLGDAAERQSKDLAAANNRFEQIVQRISACEASARAEAFGSGGNVGGRGPWMEAQLTSLRDRLDRLEGSRFMGPPAARTGFGMGT